MPRKSTPGEYNEWLEQDGRGIVALEPYVNSRIPILHQCPKGEDHKWSIPPRDIKHNNRKTGSGCPHCSIKKRITPAEYNAWLEQDGRGIVALEPYTWSHIPILHQCSEGHQWSRAPNNIKQGDGCPHCSGRIPTDYNQWLEKDGRGYVALEPYVNSQTSILHQCSEGHQWDTAPNNIKQGTGCPHCAGQRPPDYNQWLEQNGRGFVALEPYVNNCTKILHQCPEGHQWSAIPANIKRGRGCPDCSETATDANVFYIWENADDAGVYKVGITSERCADKRIGHCTRLNKMKANIILMIAVRDARDIENKALEMGESVDYPTSIDGHTEFRRYTDHELGKVYQLAVRSA